jgi:hypothetical protein
VQCQWLYHISTGWPDWATFGLRAIVYSGQFLNTHSSFFGCLFPRLELCIDLYKKK